MKRLRPDIVILMELELWPNLISSASEANIPVVIVNGRISGSSFKNYKMVRYFLSAYFNKLEMFCVQTRTYAERLMHLGVEKRKIKVTGNALLATKLQAVIG